MYLVRPLSPKGYSELIFKDAAASIRRTGQEFQYQLVVQRAYEEGEEELLDDDEGENGVVEGLGGEKDEKTFLLDEGLHFRSEIREGGEKVLAWRDLSGDPGDLYQFVCDRSVPPGEVATFEMVAMKCQYERKYRKSESTATEKDLHQFLFNEQTIPSASPVTSPLTSSPITSKFSNTKETTSTTSALAKENKIAKPERKAKEPREGKDSDSCASIGCTSHWH